MGKRAPYQESPEDGACIGIADGRPVPAGTDAVVISSMCGPRRLRIEVLRPVTFTRTVRQGSEAPDGVVVLPGRRLGQVIWDCLLRSGRRECLFRRPTVAASPPAMVVPR